MTSDALTRLTAALADRYTLERELGQGGMATVYLAEDLKHQRKVAVKVLRPELAATLGSERFAREIAVAARLQHPHILGLLDSGEIDGFFYYVMPYVDGETLRDRLARGGELPVHEAVRLLGEIADALAVAHRSGVVHRDIKPENILLSGRHAMVMDFGVAKAVTEATGAHQLTSIGVALGTPSYMAPEQATADPQMDGRVDIYALGVLAYEMLSGQPPFHGLNPQQTLAAHVTQAPTPLGQRRPGLSPMLEQVVMRCLEKRPADRFQTADDLVTALEPLTTPSGGTTPHATVPYQAAVQAPRSRRGLLIAAAVVVLGVAGWGASRMLAPKPLMIEVGKSRQVTRDPIPEIHVAISPDGREVAYMSGWSAAETHIAVRDIEGGRPLALTGEWGGAQLFPQWMPDGRSLVFGNATATTDHAAGRWKLPRLGGEAVRLDSADQLAVGRGTYIRALGTDSLLVTTADNRRFTYATAGALKEAVGLTARVRGDGSAVTFMVGNRDYVTNWTNVAPSAIWVIVLGKPPVRVTDDKSLNASPAWLPDGTLLYISNKDGARDIWAVSLDRDGAPRDATRKRLTTGLDAYSISIADDGRTLAYDRMIVRQNIYAIPIPASGVASVANARPVTTGNQLIERLALSPDGKWLAFDSNVEGNQEIFVLPSGGGEARRVTRNSGDDFAPNFSGDASQITFHSTRNGNRDLYLINADGSGEQRVTSDSSESFNPAFSPDGLRIAFGTPSGLRGQEELGLLERASTASAWQGPTRLPVAGGFAPRWSPDGTRLAYDLRGDSAGIGVLPLGGAPRTLVQQTAGIIFPRWPEWSPDSRSIYFYARDANNIVGLYQVPATGGAPRLVVRFDVPQRQLGPSSPAAIGNGLVYFVVRELESDIYVMDLVWK
ncbi:MAG: PD40 domain-containing protein [Gemmatimonadales bacterium]|nr:PD40 domain-containing protein [Gemmatimonadales bacterium]